MILTCTLCHQSGPCKCWAKCERCGRAYPAKNGACDQAIHQFDAEAERAFRNGYWTVEEGTDKLYKTRASEISVIYEKMRKRNIWLSKKDFYEDVRLGLEMAKAVKP